MNDMKSVIVPNSSQMNADDLLAGPITIKITDIQIKDSKEQRVWIFFDGDNGKPYKPSKSMCRVMVVAWGPDASKYIGHSMMLYRDPTVPWAGLAVGGIKISHMTGIEESMTIVLTATRQSKKPHVVKPLKTESAAPQTPKVERPGITGDATADPAGVAMSVDAAAPTQYVTADQALSLDARCSENGIDVARLKRAAKVERLSMILAADYSKATDWVNAAIAKMKEHQS